MFRIQCATSPEYAAFSPDGKYVVSGGCDQIENNYCNKSAVRVWGVNSGPDLPYFSHDGEIFFANLIPDSKLLLTGGYDNTVRIWSLDTLEEINRIIFPEYLTELSLSPNGKFFASGGYGDNNIVQVWDAEGELIKNIESDGYIPTITFSSDGKYMAIDNQYGANGNLSIYNTSNWNVVTNLYPSSLSTPLRFSPDGHYIGTGGCDETIDPNCIKHGTITIWDAQTGDRVSRMSHGNSVNIFEFNHAGNLLLSGGCDIGDVYQCKQGSVRIWDFLSGKEISRHEYSGDVSSVVFSPDDSLAAAGGCNLNNQVDQTLYTCESSSIYVLDFSSGNTISHITFAGGSNMIQFSPDGSFIVASDTNGLVHVFDVKSGFEVAQNSHLNNTKVSFFSLDGEQIISAGGDGKVKIWIWYPDDLVSYACSHVTRNLTKEEWDRYIKNAIPYSAICSNIALP